MMFVVAAARRMPWMVLVAVGPCVLAVAVGNMKTMLEGLLGQICSLSEADIEEQCMSWSAVACDASALSQVAQLCHLMQAMPMLCTVL